jgi:hypothetical protein
MPGRFPLVPATLTGDPFCEGGFCDDSPITIQVTVAPISVAEDDGIPLLFTFELSAPLGFATTVTYTMGGTATNGVDYTGSSVTGTRTITPGQTTSSVIITPVVDTIVEGSESVSVTINSAICNGVFLEATIPSATGEITDPEFVPVPAGPWRTVNLGTSSVRSDGTYCATTGPCSGTFSNALTVAFMYNGQFTPSTSSNIVAVGPVTPSSTTNDTVCGGPNVQAFTELKVTVLMANGSYQTLGGIFVADGPLRRLVDSGPCFNSPYSDTRTFSHAPYSLEGSGQTYYFPPP